MGKIKTRILGLEEVEEKQKKEQKMRSEEKKLQKKKEKKTSVIAIRQPAEKQSQKKISDTNKAKKPEKKVKKIRIKPRGKKYQEAKKLADKTKTYSLEEIISILKKMNLAKFDQSVELHLVVDQVGLKGEVELPHLTGKTVKVAIVDEKILENLGKNKIDFDILVTHPSFMPRLARFAKVLGPRGLMPNPKAGTISPHPEEVVKKFAKGVLRWKTEAKFPLIHQMIGKISYDDKKLAENTKKFMDTVGISHIQKAYLKSTMSPSLKLTIEK